MGIEKQMGDLKAIRQRIEPLRKRLLEHPMYSGINSVDGLQIFMQHHVFAVWDFMSLLKYLQKSLTCTAYPWVPAPNPELSGFINEIVLGEESDVYGDTRLSHFEIYLQAMRQSSANMEPIESFASNLQCGMPLDVALRGKHIPQAAREFVKTTFDILQSHKVHAVAAAFTFGREDLIPEMFRKLIGDLDDRFPGRLGILKYYITRHIEVDGNEHGPLALKLVQHLCGSDKQKWHEAGTAALMALEARERLWNAILHEVNAGAEAD